MTIEEAIKYAESMAILSHKGSGNTVCEHNHRQLAEWLRELKQLRQAIKDARREIEQLMYKPITNGGQIAQNLAYENCLEIIDKHLKEGGE